MNMLKSFSPLLGHFKGHGSNKEGSILLARMNGYEIITDISYGFRLEVIDEESQKALINSFLLLSLDAQGFVHVTLTDHIMHTSHLQWESQSRMAPAESQSRIFLFQGVRDNKAPLHLRFEITSAEKFGLTCASNQSNDKILRHQWQLEMERGYDQSSRAA
jgi:hypothetical protein